ncbi:MAG: protein phosphatase 2C domain-containing protein [Gemmataceae bacterium]|nr:protein phosphatase 2C domain-containing protein [Gemmataceae bacterium]
MIGFDDIEFASLTDVGVKRSHNQDAHSMLPANDIEQFKARGHVFLVADGMGAHAVGELASKLAADTIPHIYSKHAQDGPISALRKAFTEANQTIHTRGEANQEFAGMGTTGTAIVIRPEGAWVGHVGDSRAYRIREGCVEQLSFDHSLLWELARRQGKSPDELQGVVPSNVIVRSLGPENSVQVDVEGPHPVQPGDTYVVCSDGLCGPVSDEEIGAAASTLPAEEACRFLIHLANMKGGPDNITLVVAKIAGTPESDSMSDAPIPEFETKRRTWRERLESARHWPWPFVGMGAGIVLAGAAIALQVNKLPGAFASFILAGLALAAGIGGLIYQSMRDDKSNRVEPPRKLKIYRRIKCVLDEGLLMRLQTALESLQTQAAERKVAFDERAVASLTAASQAAFQVGDLGEAFREHARAMMTVMDALHLQRGKSESFKPHWTGRNQH